VEWSSPCRRICLQGNNWLPTAFRETSSVNRESELAQWNRDSFYAYNGLYQHTTTMRYGGTFMLKNYAQFLRDGAGRGGAAEKDFCEQIMSFDGKRITFQENVNYNVNINKNADERECLDNFKSSITWHGTNRFSAAINSNSKTKFPVVYYPGWKATLTGTSSDGKPTTISVPVYQSDGLFLGLETPNSNAWTAEIQFFPQSVYIGALISFGSWLTLFFVVIIKNQTLLNAYFSKKS
jgi:hypothetical protein